MPRPDLWAEKSRVDRHLRNRNDEASTPFPDSRELIHYLGLEIPGKNQHVVRFGFPEFLRCQYWNVRPRKKLSMLVGASVNREVEEIGSYSAIVE